jgi:hypothetical protein
MMYKCEYVAITFVFRFAKEMHNDIEHVRKSITYYYSDISLD